MKKFHLLLLTFVFSFLLTACSDSGSESGSPSGNHGAQDTSQFTVQTADAAFTSAQEKKMAQVSGCAAIIQVTINPQFELYLDAQGQLIKAEALNADGSTVLSGCDVTGLHGFDALRTLLVTSHEKGFITSMAGITVTPVAGKELVDADQLSGEITHILESLQTEFFPTQEGGHSSNLTGDAEGKINAVNGCRALVELVAGDTAFELYLGNDCRVLQCNALTAQAQAVLSEANVVGQHIMDMPQSLLYPAYHHKDRYIPKYVAQGTATSVSYTIKDGSQEMEERLRDLRDMAPDFVRQLQQQYEDIFAKLDVQYDAAGNITYEYLEDRDGFYTEIYYASDGSILKKTTRTQREDLNLIRVSTSYADGTSDEYDYLPDGHVYFTWFDANGVQLGNKQIR